MPLTNTILQSVEISENPFGFGLNYGNIVYSDLKTQKEGTGNRTNLNISASVSNQGKYASDEVVQLYISVPKQKYLTPIYSLKGFQRVRLEAQKDQTVEFKLKSTDLVTYDDSGKPQVLKGNYTIYAGS